MFTNLREIQAYIKECEQKRLDLDSEEVWSKPYLPAERTIIIIIIIIIIITLFSVDFHITITI